MVNKTNPLIMSYLSNMQVKLLDANLTKCWPDWHDSNYTPSYNKLYFLLEGSCLLKVNGNEIRAEAGSIYLMPAGTLQSYRTLDNKPFRKYWCHFTATIGDMNLFDILNTDISIKADDTAPLSGMFDRLVSAYHDRSTSALLRGKSALFDILAWYLEHSCQEEADLNLSPESRILSSLMDHIENHIARDINVSELADIAHLHPNYLIRYFKKHTGYSPIHYINRVRLERAKSLLAGTNLPVKEIAVSTGFADLYYFSRNFKSTTGYSPSEFRKLQQESRT